MQTTSKILLIAGIIILVNLISNQFFLRFDLTENKQYTLSKATKDILNNLSDPVTVTAYFTKDLPTQYQKNGRDFRDLLIEYQNTSKGMVDYEFVNPSDGDDKKQEAQQNGVQPLLINVREKDQIKQQQAYMGAVIKVADRQEVIPFVQPGASMEYNLSTLIKKVTVVDKPAVGMIQGHGEPAVADLQKTFQDLSILYNVETLDLNQEPVIADRFRAVALINPKDTIPPAHLAALDAYLSTGGNLVLAFNTVEGDLSNAQGQPFGTGLRDWLLAKGIDVKQQFLIDAECGTVSVQQRQGPFVMNTPVSFPFFPVVKKFFDHPITEGLEQVFFPFASPIEFTGNEAGITFTPIIKSSEKSGIISPPTFFDVRKNWTSADFTSGPQVLGGVLSGTLSGGSNPSNIVIFSDGDFAANGQQNPDNSNLLVNSIDFLSDDTGLIELRTKEVTSRPLDAEILTDEASGTRQFYKLLNFLLPILLVVGYGIFRGQMRRRQRMNRMMESYE